MKFHCWADLLFYLFGFNCVTYVELATDLIAWSNPNQSNWRSAYELFLWLVYRKQTSLPGIGAGFGSLRPRTEVFRGKCSAVGVISGYSGSSLFMSTNFDCSES